MTIDPSASVAAEPRRADRAAWLDHRIFEHNPLYLLSAASVLGGVFIASGELSRSTASLADLWITAINEVYQLALIASAALLFRLRGQRRPAVMLALIQVVFLCDLTFDTEVAGYGGAVGTLTALLWLALFALKLRLLVWALRLRLSRSAYALPLCAAASLVLFPHLLQRGVIERQLLERIVGLSAFGLFAVGLWLRPRIESREALDAWGTTVLRRARAATWAIWSAGLVGHLAWWCHAYGLDPLVLLAAGGLLACLRAPTEKHVWPAVIGVLLVAAVWDATILSPAAAMAACVLGLRGRRGFLLATREDRVPERSANPYRAATAVAQPAQPELGWRRVDAPRLVVGAWVCGYLSLWSWSWTGGALPAHCPWLALPFALLLAGLAWRRGSGLAGGVALALGGHLAVQRELVAAPASPLQWAALLLGGGFALLGVGVAINWHLSRRQVTTDAALPGVSGSRSRRAS